MSTKVQRDFTFQAGAHFDSTFIMNLYTVTMSMYVQTEDIREQTVAMERIKYYIYDCLEGCVFIENSNSDAIKKYNQAGIKVCNLPSEPYEQIIAMLLLLKLNNFVEDKLLIYEIKILSKLSDGVTIIYEIEDSLGPFDQNGWWNNKKIVINDLNFSKDNDNVVKILSRPHVTWEDVGLTWSENNAESSLPSTVVSIRDNIDK